MKTILSIDPGSEKCGLAVVTTQTLIHKEITSRDDLVRVARSLAAQHRPDEIIIGGGTGGKALADELLRLISEIPIRVVDESFSTQKARTRFFKDNPPRGIRRFIPRGLLTPDRPYDDYVALILAEEYLRVG